MMTRRFTLTIAMMALVASISAQDASRQSFRNLLGHEHPTSRTRGMDSFKSQMPERFALHNAQKKKYPQEAKSAASFTTRFDSVLVGDTYKAIYSYDANGNCTLEASYDLEGLNGWVNTYSEESVYNIEDQLVEYIVWEGYNSQMVLEPNYRITYAYQEDGLMTELANFIWIENEWAPASKRDHTYDDEGNLVEILESNWNESTEQYDVFGQLVYTYNADNVLIQFDNFSWVDGAFSPTYKRVHTLNDENQALLSMAYQWNDDNADWEPIGSVEYFYNAAGLEVESVRSDWVDNAFVFASKREQGYDDFDRRISEIWSSWNSSGSAWVNHSQNMYVWDGVNNLLENVGYFWDVPLGEFVLSSEDIFTYNSNILAVNIMAPSWYAEEFLHMVLNNTYTTYSDGQLVETYNYDLYYTSLDLTSVADPNDKVFQVYPNPFRETLRFSGIDEVTEFSLFDLQGRIVAERKLSGTSELNVEDVPSGMYIYQINGPMGRQSGKLVRE